MKRNLLPLLLLVALFPFTNFAQITSAGVKGNWSSASTWASGKVPTASDDVIIAVGDTVTLDAATAEMKNLTIKGVLQFNKTVAVTMTVNGDIFIDVDGGFKVQNRTITSSLLNTLDLKGNLTHNGKLLDFRSGSSGSTLGVCNVTFSGNKNSVVKISTPYSSTNGDFNAVTINKTDGAKVILESNLFINGGSSSEPAAQSILTFVNGIVETGQYAIIHQTSTEANVTGYSDKSYVVGNMGRGMSNSGGSTKTFPVGDAKGFRPIKVRSTTAGSATGHYVTVGVVSGNANTGSSKFSGGIDKVSAVRYYKVTYNKGGGAANMKFDKFMPSYGTDDGVKAGNVNLRVAYSLDERANWIGLNQTLNHVTDLSAPPTTITPDSVATPFQIDDGKSFYVALARVSGTTENTLDVGTDVEDVDGIPSSFELLQNYPNPFNPSTQIGYKISQSSFVTLKVYNSLGKEVATLVNEFKQPGIYKANFSTDSYKLSSGVYYYTLKAGNYIQTKKMLLIK